MASSACLTRIVNEEFLKEFNADAIILATGGKPACLPIEGIDGPRVTTAQEILDNNVNPGQNVLVIGGGMTGVETADYMGELGRLSPSLKCVRISLSTKHRHRVPS